LDVIASSRISVQVNVGAISLLLPPPRNYVKDSLALELRIGGIEVGTLPVSTQVR
jgi:hypothetical protein